MYGLTESGAKTTGRDPRVLPRLRDLRPELSRGLPFGITVVSMLNAIAHAAEGLYAPDANPVIDLIAQEGIRTGAAALPRLQRDPRAHRRTRRCAGCRMALRHGDGQHHCWPAPQAVHTLGGSFNLPHAEVHTVVLPHAMAYNAAAAPEAMQRIAAALQAASAPAGLFDLGRKPRRPTALEADWHAGLRSRSRCRHRRAEPVSEPALASNAVRSANCFNARSTGTRPD